MSSRTKVLLIAALVLVLWIVLAWFTGTWLGLEGSSLMWLRVALILLGVLGTAGFVWLYLREQNPTPEDASSELDAAFHEADSRLTSSDHAARARIAEMPSLLITGATGSAKTTSTIHSGLEPELLSGQVYHDRDVVPTRGVNIWYAQQNVFVEIGGTALNDAASRKRLVRRLMPARLKSVMGKKGQAPRAVVVCMDCESFLRPGGAESTAVEARQLNGWLTQLAQQLGIRLPVYVLFTKMDRVPHFREYVANMTLEEAAQVLGVTLPLQPSSSGSYGETETRRLNEELDTLYRSLADRRPDLLSREHEAANLPPSYEFPREFRKLRALLVQFMVDLCRPSQLHTSPYLRGFYFTGVRPYVVQDVIREDPAPRRTEAFDAGATGVFRPGAFTPSPSPQASSGRRVPQWVFLNHLFAQVILRDQTAQSSSGSSVRIGAVRRVGYVAAMLVAAFLIGAWTVSWFGNRSLTNRITEATSALPVIPEPRSETPTLEELQRLEQLRVELEQLAQWRREGAPWRLRFGLYNGEALYPNVYRGYFQTFRNMLLGTTQDALIRFMARPADQAESAQSVGYRPVYDALKAYLITTSHPDKSTQVFLPPELLSHWSNGREVDEERLELINRQFTYYAGELPVENPFPDSEEQAQPVAAARAYLARFGGGEAIYAAMLAAAGENNPAFIFNTAYPDSASTVANTYPVPGAFTSPGWTFMQAAINDPRPYYEGEQWVLGEQSTGNIDVAALQASLRDRYRTDFIQHWRNYLDQTRVLRYSNIRDAASKLERTGGNRSPLLLAICAASENTNVDDQAIKDQFQPVALVSPAPCREQLPAANQGYRSRLNQLQASLVQLQDNTEDEASFSAANTNVTQARGAVLDLATSFPIDREGGVDTLTQNLLEAPIDFAGGLIKGVPLAGVNSGAQAFCGQFRTLMQKFPFSPRSTNQATVEEVNRIFRPGDGALWLLYNGNLDRFLVRSGSQYVPVSGGAMSVTAGFRNFFNQAAGVSQAFYPGNAQNPNLTFRLKLDPATTVDAMRLNIDGKEANLSQGRDNFEQFTWLGPVQEVRVGARIGGGSPVDVLTYGGLWAPFSFFYAAEQFTPLGGQYSVRWTPRTNNQPMRDNNGRDIVFRLILDMDGAPPVFDPRFFSGLSCTGTAVQ